MLSIRKRKAMSCSSGLLSTENKLLDPPSSKRIKPCFLTTTTLAVSPSTVNRLLSGPSDSATHSKYFHSLEYRGHLTSTTHSDLVASLLSSSALLNTKNSLLTEVGKSGDFDVAASSSSSLSFQEATITEVESVIQPEDAPKEPPKVLENVQESELQNMPQYEFPSLNLEAETPKAFCPFTSDQVFLIRQKEQAEKSAKMCFLSAVSTSLMHTPNFENPQDPVRMKLIGLAKDVAEFDPEFVLKDAALHGCDVEFHNVELMRKLTVGTRHHLLGRLRESNPQWCYKDEIGRVLIGMWKTALYTRQELHIRKTANFLLAYASLNEDTKFFLQRYFSASVRLPSDWIDVAELCQVFDSVKALPAALRKAMKVTFPQFDKYQLAKYNKQKKKKTTEKSKEKTLENEIGTSVNATDDEDMEVDENSPIQSDDDDEENEKVIEKRAFSLKRLIRLLHISRPVEEVLALLGKRYPEDPESFRASGLLGIWDESRAGKRMKLPVPETWETQVSLRGNKASVWEELIDHSKLPYMATLRNLRNLLISGISDRHHNKVAAFISDQNRVVNSRQFPFRFFSAYQVLSELRKMKVEGYNSTSSGSSQETPWERKQRKKIAGRLNNFETSHLDNYKKAVDKAVEIATLHNLQPIPGRTVMVCDLAALQHKPCAMLKNAFDGNKKLSHGAMMLGAMCLHASEHCELMVYPRSDSDPDPWDIVTLEGRSILENVQRMFQKYCSEGSERTNATVSEREILSKFLRKYLCCEELRDNKQPLNNFIFLTGSSKSEEVSILISKFLRRYRALVNPDLLYVHVDLMGNAQDYKFDQDNDVYIAGFSDQLLKFVAERGSGTQIAYVENIDVKYDLQPISNHHPKTYNKNEQKAAKLVLSPQVSKWKTVRIFVSSTFRDMHSERDVLARYVFPELCSRAIMFHINVYEVDLRWGVTEKEATDASLLDVCLTEVSRCQLFVGILGNRYGYVPSKYIVPDSPEFDWVRNYPHGASLTEMEIQCGALNKPNEAKEKAYFYIRDDSFEKDIPERWKSDFHDGGEACVKLSALKKRIRSSGLKVYDGYPCHWIGEVDGRPVVGGLERFGQHILDDLWGAIKNLYIHPAEGKEDTDPYSEHLGFAAQYKSITGRKEIVNECLKNVEKNNSVFHVIEGKAGSGKTALMAHLSHKLNNVAFVYFVGLLPESSGVRDLLSVLVRHLCEEFSLYYDIPEDKESLKFHFSDILRDASRRSGNGQLIILIDGLDFISEDASEQVQWIPYDIPSGVKFIFSCTLDSPAGKHLLRRREIGQEICLYSLKPITVPDRRVIITAELDPYRKALEDDPFNNQMSILSTKQDAGNFLYLQMACAELRAFGIFEQLTSKLHKFAPNLPLLLQATLLGMEKTNGKDLIQNTLCILSLSKEGLEEQELHYALSKINSGNGGGNVTTVSFIPSLKFLHLLYSLKRFLSIVSKNGTQILKMGHQEVIQAVQRRYLLSLKKEIKAFFHKCLADYFRSIADPTGNCLWNGRNPRAVRCLLYHLLEGNFLEELSEVLCDLSFINSAFSLGIGFVLLDAYVLVLRHLEILIKQSENFRNKCGRKSKNVINYEALSSKLREYFEFVLQNLEILQRLPSAVWQQAKLQHESQHIQKASLRLNEYTGFELVPTYYQKPVWKLSNFKKVISCLAISSDETSCALGGRDGIVRLIDLNTSKLEKTFIGHSSAITQVMFVGQSLLCSSSSDCTLMLWNIMGGNRVAVLNGHSRPVTSCCSDVSGTTLVSGSWDHTICVWSPTDGRKISTISKNSCPVNSLAFHPTKQVVVSGGWDKKVKLWDLQSLRRIAALSGHTTSVQSVAITPCGGMVISSSANGEVFLWSGTSGHRLGSFKDHVGPVYGISICFANSYVATAGSDLSVKLWSYNQAPSYEIKASHLIEDACFICLINEANLAVSSKSHVQIVNLSSGKVTHNHIVDDAQVMLMKNYAFSYKKADYCGVIVAASNGNVEMLDTISKDISKISFPSCRFTALGTAVNWIILGTETGEVIVAHMRKPSEKYSICAHKGPVYLCTFSADELSLPIMNSSVPQFTVKEFSFATVGDDQHIRLWSISKGEEEKEELKLTQIADYSSVHSSKITAVAICIAQDILITAAQDTTIILHNLQGKHTQKNLEGIDSPFVNIVLGNNLIFAGAENGSICIWTFSGSKVAYFPGDQNSPNTHMIDFLFCENRGNKGDHDSELNAFIAVVDNYGSISLRKPLERIEQSCLGGHGQGVVATHISKSGRFILSSSLDKSVCLWRNNGKSKATSQPDKCHSGSITALDCCFQTGEVVTGDDQGHIYLWKYEDEKLKRIQEIGHPCSYVVDVRFFGRDGSRILGACNLDVGTDLRVYAKKTRPPIEWKAKPEYSYHIPPGMDISSLFHHDIDGKYILLCDAAFTVSVLNSKLLIIQQKSVFDKTSDNVAGGDFVPFDGNWKNLVKTSEQGSEDQIGGAFGVNDKQLHFPTCMTMFESKDNSLGTSEQKFYIGDSDGYLIVKSKKSFKAIKIHNSSVLKIVIFENLLFSCSKDQCIKVWKLPTFELVGLFRCDEMITTLSCATWRSNEDLNEMKSVYILVGTVSSGVQILKWCQGKM